MAKKLTLTIVGLLVVVAALVGIKALQIRKMMTTPMQMPPETVTATVVKDETWPNSFTSTGSVAAVQGVTIGAEVAGKITKIEFEAGATVKAGDV
jgi:membrane fusion protein (multidrug efflux system)